MHLRYTAACLVLTLVLSGAQAQSPVARPDEAGAPFLQYYSLKAQQIHPENWALCFDRRGLLYTANVEGVVEHDGQSWRVIPVEGRRVRSLALGADGRIYVGAEGTFGRLEPDAKGLLEYKSLVEQLPAEAREFANVYQLVAVGPDLYLNLGSHLARFGPTGPKAWKALVNDGYQKAFSANGQLYVQELSVGLRVLKGDALETIESGQIFSDIAQRIDALVPYNERRVLIATRGVGLFLYDAELGLQPLPSDVAPLLADDQLYCGAALPSGEFALGTLRGGVHLIDRQGRRLRTLGRADGLPPGKVYELRPDAQGSLWLAMDRGLAHIELPYTLTRFGDGQGLIGAALAVQRHGGTLYAATSTGVYALQPGQRAAFAPVGGLAAQAWHLASVEGDLLVASTQGVFALRGSALVPVSGDDPSAAFVLHAARHQPGRVYVGLINGIGVLERGPRGWALVGRLPGYDRQVNWIVESPAPGPGGSVALWFGDATSGVARALIYQNADPVVELFTSDDGLPYADGNRAALVAGQLVFGTRQGLYNYDEPTRRFALAAPLGSELSRQPRAVRALLPVGNELTWALTYSAAEGQRLWQLKGIGDATRGLRTPLGRVAEQQIVRLYADTPADGGALWLAGDDGLVRYDPSVKKSFLAPYRALIRSVLPLADSTGGAIIYMGLHDSTRSAAEVTHEFNSLRASVGTTAYDHPEATEFQYRLEPIEPTYSRWTRESYRDYTNLFEGTYTLRVRARNAYGQMSSEDSYTFTIAPPWYRTWLAYGIYALVFLAALYGFLRWRIAQLEADKRVLEQKVAERTAELQQANTEILAQKSELENAYEEIRATNEQLNEALHEIEEKNRDITDSIQYARRIQEAILPPENEWVEALPDAFVLYKPRDIVSGDFYWLLRTDGLTYVAAVDCTGHGVPGAFMSVMGNSLLHEIIGQSGARDPGEILTRLDKRVQQTLRQVAGTPGSSSASKDGMEVALLCFDTRRSELAFAGANRPLFYVRDGQMHEVEPDKVPIGYHSYTEIERFTTTRIAWQRGDIFYAFSDGYGDQFGGERGRKFMVKNLKDLLLKHHADPMSRQRDLLGQTIETWRGGRPQIDDILVMGIRV